MASSCEQVSRRRTVSTHVDKSCSKYRCSCSTVTALKPIPSMTATMASGGQKSLRSIISASENIRNKSNPPTRVDTDYGEQSSRSDGVPERYHEACWPWPENGERQIGS